MPLLFLAAQILLSALALFGLYVLLRSAFSVKMGAGPAAIAVLASAQTAADEIPRLYERARDDAWLCGACRVIFLASEADAERLRESISSLGAEAMILK